LVAKDEKAELRGLIFMIDLRDINKKPPLHSDRNQK
jgi:hypothetical protein